MATTYREITEKFIPRVKSYEFYQYADEESLMDVVSDYLVPALMEIKSSNVDLTDRNDILETFNFTLDDNMIESILGYMTVKWIEFNFINDELALKARLTSTEYHAYQQSNMLDKCMTIRDAYLKRNDQRCVDDSYKNGGFEAFKQMFGKR